ncbi:type IV pilus assembly protein PilA [Dyella sp. SG562]|jgi:type IV pilus assembly protein PilA|uniref:pilin n=1 Tax=Dyella sp. SG562 TaxID=2587017 RepID=UPI001420F9B9|nr:pilin [Dyella sp. SG562]NII71613.1 type IV pilus assembly protein PilA [Dyella sp. SG562]
MKNVQKGFTLIELMIVVAIIAILAAIAIPAYQDYTIRSQVSEGLSLADASKTSLAEYYSNYGDFPTNQTSAGLPAPTAISGNYVKQVDATGTKGQIQITYGNKSNTKITGKILILSSSTTAGSTTWKCKSTTVDPKYLPSSCRN